MENKKNKLCDVNSAFKQNKDLGNAVTLLKKIIKPWRTNFFLHLDSRDFDKAFKIYYDSYH